MKFALDVRSLAPLVSSASEILLGTGLCRGWQKVSAQRKLRAPAARVLLREAKKLLPPRPGTHPPGKMKVGRPTRPAYRAEAKQHKFTVTLFYLKMLHNPYNSGIILLDML